MKILGAGISGLTAAINLALEGQKVEVYEKNTDVGMQLRENAQMLPNWLTNENDILKEMGRCNIRIKPTANVNNAHLFMAGKKLLSFKSQTPLGYTVIRGGAGSLEVDLKRQAEKSGVIIHAGWNKKVKADIIATGHKRTDAVIYGKVCEGSVSPNEVYVFIDFKHFPGGYAYIYPHNKKRASLVVGKLAASKINLKESMEKVSSDYKDLLDSFGMSPLYDFGGFSGFEMPESAVRNGSIYVGEAAGFQDPLFGFGMKYAIKSGYFAAKSIVEKTDYDALWKEEFVPEMKKLLAMRQFFYGIDKGTLNSISKINLEKLSFEKISSLVKSNWFGMMLSFYNRFPKSRILKKLMLSVGIRILRYL